MLLCCGRVGRAPERDDFRRRVEGESGPWGGDSDVRIGGVASVGSLFLRTIDSCSFVYFGIEQCDDTEK